MDKMGYVVIYKEQKFYTYNRILAIKIAKKYNGEIKKISSEKTKKVLDIIL